MNINLTEAEGREIKKRARADANHWPIDVKNHWPIDVKRGAVTTPRVYTRSARSAGRALVETRIKVGEWWVLYNRAGKAIASLTTFEEASPLMIVADWLEENGHERVAQRVRKYKSPNLYQRKGRRVRSGLQRQLSSNSGT